MNDDSFNLTENTKPAQACQEFFWLPEAAFQWTAAFAASFRPAEKS